MLFTKTFPIRAKFNAEIALQILIHFKGPVQIHTDVYGLKKSVQVTTKCQQFLIFPVMCW